MVAAFDFCLHGLGGVVGSGPAGRGAAPSIDTAMHGLVDAAARRPPAPRLRHRAGDRRRRGEADRRVFRRPGGVGAVAAARLPARPGHRRDRRGQPAGHRLHPRRPRHHGLGRDQRRVRGPLAGDHPHRGGVHRGQRPPGAVRPGHRGLRAAARGAAAGPGGRAGPGDPRPGLDRPAAGRALHRRRGRARLHSAGPSTRGWRRSARPAPITSCAPRCGRWSSTCRRTLRSRTSWPGCASCTRPTARTTPPTTSGTPGRTRPRCAAPTRRSCWCPGSGCSATAPASRPPGWPGSSTSTRST